ncbi:MAG TPA: carboxypeptidase regulatory-like domain-containing protein [Polyangiaceae bacterium]|nr:carboxypeptidase regulatory-like domain-containing protein [Polyangiaceae bacterium]
MPNLRSTAGRVARSIAASMAIAVVLGGIPGGRLRTVGSDRGAAPRTIGPVVREGIIAVMVHSRSDQRPIPGAHVRVLSIVDDRAYLAGERTTDSFGRARLTKLPLGEVWVMADAPGRARASTRLVASPQPSTLILQLAPAHAVSVLVRDEIGAAVRNAEIEAVAASDPLPVGVRTDAAGAAVLDRIGSGPWQLTAHAPGYEDAVGRADRDGECVTLVLRKLGSLEVRVRDAVDRPAGGAHVLLAGAMLWPPRSADADSDGEVRIAGLAAGTYALRATKDDAASPIDLGVVLGRGENKVIDLHLARARFLRVRVTDGDGDAAGGIAGARVTLAEGEISPFPLEATTDASGRARLGPFALGIATLAARADGFVARGALVIGDPPPSEARVALARAGALSGRVLDTGGRPVDGATLEIVGTDPAGGPIVDDPRRARFQAAHFAAMLPGSVPLVSAGELGVVPGPVPSIPRAIASLPKASGSAGEGWSVDPGGWVTRSDGTFLLSPASPGRVRVLVHHPQYVDAQSDVVTLAPGGQASVEVTLHEGGVLEGRVLDARDEPVTGARVFVSAVHGTLERSSRTASDGTFAFAALPEAVNVGVSASQGEMPDFRTTIEIPEGGREQMTIRLPAARDPLPIAVVDEGDAPIESAQVTATSLTPDSLLRLTVFTSADGQAQIKGAQKLPLRIEARAPSRAPRIVITTGTEESVRIELDPAERADGQVVAASGGQPIAGAEVTLYTELGARHATTDARGAFALNELASGAAALRVRATGFAPAERTIAIPDTAGRRAYSVARVEMTAEGIAEGDVVDASGAPVPGARVARDHVPTWLLVGSNPRNLAIADAEGHFRLGELPEGSVTLEAYAPDFGRTQASVQIVGGRTTDRIRMLFGQGSNDVPSAEPSSTGSVAVTLGETGAPSEVVVVSVVEGSEAERAGLSPGDVVVTVDGVTVHTMGDARARLSGPAGDDVLMDVRRAGRDITLRVGREAVRR